MQEIARFSQDVPLLSKMIDNCFLNLEKVVYLNTHNMANFLLVWADSAKLEDSGKIQAPELPKFSRIFKVSSIAQWKFDYT